MTLREGAPGGGRTVTDGLYAIAAALERIAAVMEQRLMDGADTS